MKSRLTVVLALVGLTAGCARALDPVDTSSPLSGGGDSDPAAAEELMRAARTAFAQRPDLERVRVAEQLWLDAAVADGTDATPIIGAVGTLVWLAENLPDHEERQRKASAAVTTAQWCRRRAADNPACPYWLALAVGVQANQNRATANDALAVMVRALEEAIARDPKTDHAGPHRVLALVLVRAPGWPAGPGDPDTALVHAEKAVDLAADFAPNWLALGEARHATDQEGPTLAAYRCALDLAREQSEHPEAPVWVAEAEAALVGNVDVTCPPRIH